MKYIQKNGAVPENSKIFRCRPSSMAEILAFFTDFQVAPYMECCLLGSTMVTEGGTSQSKGAAFWLYSLVPNVHLTIYTK